MMAGSKSAPFTGRIQKRKTLSLHRTFRLATHGRSIQLCQQVKSLCGSQNLVPRLRCDGVGADRASMKFPPQRRMDQ